MQLDKTNKKQSRHRNGLTKARAKYPAKNVSKGATRVKRNKISEMNLVLISALTPHLQTPEL